MSDSCGQEASLTYGCKRSHRAGRRRSDCNREGEQLQGGGGDGGDGAQGHIDGDRRGQMTTRQTLHPCPTSLSSLPHVLYSLRGL